MMHFRLPLHSKIQIIRPVSITKVRKPLIIRSSVLSDSIISGSALAGKGVILFTFIYCSLQWKMYRDVRKHIEEKKNKDKKD